MTCCWLLVLTAATLCSIWRLDVLAFCDISTPMTETAYVGAYEIRFPDCPYGIPDISRCRWLISAYRKDYVIHLEFDDVILEKNYQVDACVEEISVYDGPKTTDAILASFCGNEKPKLMTSSRDALIVFSSNKSSLVNGTFKLKYKAIRDRQLSGDTSHVIRISFGVFFGAIACGVIFSCVFRKYQKTRPNRSVPILGCPRVHTSNGAGREIITASARNGDTRERDNSVVSQMRRPERMSFKNKVSGFFQDVVMKLSPRRMAVGSSTIVSSDGTHHQQQLQNGRINNNQNQSASLTSINIRNNSGLYPSNILQNPFHAGNNLGSIREGHLAFGYPIIPLSSFTSDPNAVRPPTYEDCINSVNPLYLHHHSTSTFLNRAFDLKDEASDCVQISSPPPPYSEIGQEIPSLGGVSEGLSNSTRIFPRQQPPQYEETTLGVTVIPPTNSEADGDESAYPEQSCERGETLIHMTTMQDRSVLSQPVQTTLQITQLPSLDNYNSLTSAPIIQPEAVSDIANKCTSHKPKNDNRQRPKSSSTSKSTASAIQLHSNNTSDSATRTSTSIPLDLFRRSGLVSVQSTDNSVFCNNEAVSEISATQGSKTTDILCVKSSNPGSQKTEMDDQHFSEQSQEFSQSIQREINPTLNSCDDREVVESRLVANIVLSDLEEDTITDLTTHSTNILE